MRAEFLKTKFLWKNGFKFIAAEPKPQSALPRVRYVKAESRAAQIRAYKQEHPSMSNRAIAKIFHVVEGTVRNALKRH